MGNKRKVWLACGAAIGLPLTGIAQNVRQVQVTETNGRVEIHVIGVNLPKPTDVSRNKDFAYTLEWQAGLQSGGGRIRVGSGNVKSVSYGWWSSHPHTMRVRVQTGKAMHPDLIKNGEGWVIAYGGHSDAAENSIQANKHASKDDLWAEAQGESNSPKAGAHRSAPRQSKSVEMPLESEHNRVSLALDTPAIAPETGPALSSKATVVKTTPAMSKWSTLEALQKEQFKKQAAKPVVVASKPVAAETLAMAEAPPVQVYRRVTLDCSNAELSQVLKGLALQSGANIVIGPSVTGKVTADLHDVTIDQALKYISYLTGVRYEKTDGIYMFGVVPPDHSHDQVQPVISGVRVVPMLSDSEDQVKAVLETKFRGRDLQVLTPVQPRPNGSNEQKTSTQSVVSSDGGSKSLVMPESYLILVGPAEVIEEAETVARTVDADIVRAHASYEKTDRIDREIMAYEVRFADPRALREALISQIPGLRAVIAPNSVGAFGVYQEGRAKRQANEDNSPLSNGNGNNNGNSSQSGQAESQVAAVAVQQANDATLEQPFSREENASVPMRLVLRGTHEQVQQALEYLRLLDVAPRQVALELRVMELTKSDALHAGIDWNILTGGAVKILNLNNSQANASNTGSLSLSGNRFNGDVTFSLDAIADKNKLIARPNLVAMDGRQSEIFIGDIVRYVESITASQNGTTVVTGEVPVGVRLSVLPRVGADGNMTLDLRPRISILTSFTPVPGGGQLPQTSSRFAQSTISLQSGQTIAIGGLIQNQDVKNFSGIPILMNLPIIGSLFRSTTITKERSELVIFLTARAINGPVGAEQLPMMKDSNFKGMSH